MMGPLLWVGTGKGAESLDRALVSVHSVATVDAAQTLLASGRVIDAVLVDVAEGNDLSELSRLAEAQPHLPVVAVSSSIGETLVKRAIAAGAHDCVAVDDRDRIQAAVARAIVRHRRYADFRIEAQAALQRSEERLRQSQKMEAIGRLAGGVAHDFNNLLTAITGYAELLRSQMSESEKGIREVDEILRAGHRAAALTGQLLTFSRKHEVKPEVLGLNGVVGEVEEMLRRLIGEQVELSTRLDPALENIRVDKMHVEQVLVNLVVNARDAMPSGGKILVGTGHRRLGRGSSFEDKEIPAGRYVTLSVSDSGCGIDDDTMGKLFEPFFTTKDPGKGTGLGLATVYGIVKQAGGYITVESEEDKGSTFCVFFPVVAESVSGAAPVDDPRLAAPTGDETVMVVEDAPHVRALVCEILSGQGYEVLQASNGRDALKLSQDHAGAIHALVTDIVMPGMGGRELAGELQGHRPDLAVLFMSGYDAEMPAAGNGRPKEENFLGKPFTSTALLGMMRKAIGAKKTVVDAVAATRR